MSDDDDEAGDEYDSVDYDTFPSLSLALEEARNRYSDEEDRRRTIETKIGILVSVDAIIISLIFSFDSIETLPTVLTITLALASILFGLYILWPRQYQCPGGDIEDIFADAGREKADFEKQFLNDYRKAITSNSKENDGRYRIFKICSVLTFLSVLVIFLSRMPLSYLCG
jgi:hypothetical protein